MTRYFSAQECSKLKFDLVIYRDSIDKAVSVLHNLANRV